MNNYLINNLNLSLSQIINQANEIDENNLLELTYLNNQPKERNNKKRLQWLIDANGSFNTYSNTDKIISKIKNLSTNNVHNEVKKRAQHYSSSELTQLRRIRSITPRLPLFRTKTVSISNNPGLVTQIAADANSPTPDNINNCWKYVNAGPPNKINWYFYADSKQVNLHRNLDIFYFVVDLNTSTTKNQPWITLYTARKNDGNDGGSFYRTRYNYTGLYNDGSITLPVGKYIFYVGNINSGIVYDKSLPLVDLGDYSTSITGPQDNDETTFLMSIQTNSGSPNGEFNFCVSEAGYKYKNKSQVRFLTTP